MLRQNVVAALCAVGCFSLAGCSKPPCGGVEALISVSTAGTGTDRVVAQVSAPQAPPKLVLLERHADRVEGLLCLDRGVRRTVSARAYDRGGRITHMGQNVVDVSSGSFLTFELEMTARRGEKPLVLRASPVEVSQGVAEIRARPGRELTAASSR
jgi:hypothetical protein